MTTHLTTPPRRGPVAWVSRKYEALCLRLKLRWLEEDRAFTAKQCQLLPRQLAQQDRDIDAMRVQLLILENQ